MSVNRNRFGQLLKGFSGKKILVAGDIMPEEFISVVAIEDERTLEEAGRQGCVKVARRILSRQLRNLICAMAAVTRAGLQSDFESRR